MCCFVIFFFSSRRRHTSLVSDWSSDVCSSDLSRPRGRPCRLHLEARGAGQAGLVGETARGLDRGGMGVVAGEARAREIGRASCRERGKEAGVAGAVKRQENVDVMTLTKGRVIE